MRMNRDPDKIAIGRSQKEAIVGNGLGIFGMILAAFVVLAYFIHIADAYLLIMLAVAVLLIGASGLPYWRRV